MFRSSKLGSLSRRSLDKKCRHRLLVISLWSMLVGYSKAAPVWDVTNDSHQLTVTRVVASLDFQMVPGVSDLPKLTAPGHYNLTVHYVSDDPDLRVEKKECGSLSRPDGTTVEVGFAGSGSSITREAGAPETAPPIQVEVICTYGVANDALGLRLTIRDYPPVDLGINELPSE